MRILYVVKTLPHTFLGGIQTHVWKLSGQMVQLGHDVTILTSGSFRNGTVVRQMEGRTVIEVKYLPGRRLPIIPTLAEEFSFNWSAKKWLLKHAGEFDLIHLQGRSGYLLPKLKQKLKTPIVTTVHGLIDVENNVPGSNRKKSIDKYLHQAATIWLEQQQLEHSDALIAVSNKMKEVLEEKRNNFDGKTEVIYNGIDMPQLNDVPVETDPNLLVFVGRLTALKGIFLLVEATMSMHKDIKLVIIGDGPDRAKLETLIEERGLERRITLTGAMPSQEVFQWIRKGFALVLPSFFESQGIVLMEANICEKPVVATSVGGILEVVKHGKNGYLFPINNIVAIAEAVNALHSKPEEAKAMGKWGKEYIFKKFSWNKIARQTEALYLSLVS